MDRAIYGPDDLSLWLQRPLGHFECLILQGPLKLDPRLQGCTVNMVAHIIVKESCRVNVEFFKEAVRATVFNHPNLRADIDLENDVPTFVPAKDFSEIFQYVDLQAKGIVDLNGVWDIVEREANRIWMYGSGKPLFQCILLQITDGYVVMNRYHHALADGTSGYRIISSIMYQYNRLKEGKKVDLLPLQPLLSVEKVTQNVKDDQKFEDMMQKAIRKAKNYTSFVPLDMQEREEHNQNGPPFGKTMFLDGDTKEYKAVRERCRKENVTVGSLSIAAGFLALAAKHAKLVCQDVDKYQGMIKNSIRIPVDLRNRVEPRIGNQAVGFFVCEVTMELDLVLESSVWDLAKNVAEKFRLIFSEKEHLLSNQVKEEFQTGEHRELFASVEPQNNGDLLISNLTFYPSETEFDWGKVESVHIAGSAWAPEVSNHVFTLGSTDKFHYDIVHCPGENNTRTAKDVLTLIYNIMENAANYDNSYTLKDILKEYCNSF